MTHWCSYTVNCIITPYHHGCYYLYRNTTVIAAYSIQCRLLSRTARHRKIILRTILHVPAPRQRTNASSTATVAFGSREDRFLHHVQYASELVTARQSRIYMWYAWHQTLSARPRCQATNSTLNTVVQYYSAARLITPLHDSTRYTSSTEPAFVGQRNQTRRPGIADIDTITTHTDCTAQVCTGPTEQPCAVHLELLAQFLTSGRYHGVFGSIMSGRRVCTLVNILINLTSKRKKQFSRLSHPGTPLNKRTPEQQVQQEQQTLTAIPPYRFKCLLPS